jgi:Exo70 exocyst complex subunit
MTKLSNLMAFSNPLAQLLMSIPTSSSQSSTTLPPLNLETDSYVILARWTMDVIDSLTNILETKSKYFLRPRSAMAANLFMLNNLSEIEKRVRKNSILQSVIGSIGAAEKEKDAAKRISRGSSGGNPASTNLFSMPKSFEKVKRTGLDGTSI